MKREDVLRSRALLKRFCTDMSIPITVYAEPYFTRRLIILDDFYDCENSFDDFCEMLEDFDNEQDYFTYYNALKQRIIDHINFNEGFISFKDTIVPKAKETYPTEELYKPENDGKVFISVDLKQANFSIVNEYCPTIFGEAEKWEDFIRRFTSYESIINSKYIRQVIFGACSPKTQIKCETYKMQKLASAIIKNVEGVTLFSVKHDEIILTDICEFGYSAIKLFLREIGESNKFHVKKFKIMKVGNYGYFKVPPKVLGMTCGKMELKCFSAETIHQVINHFYGVENTPDDLVFYHNGRLATYLEEIENPFKKD